MFANDSFTDFSETELTINTTTTTKKIEDYEILVPNCIYKSIKEFRSHLTSAIESFSLHRLQIFSDFVNDGMISKKEIELQTSEVYEKMNDEWDDFSWEFEKKMLKFWKSDLKVIKSYISSKICTNRAKNLLEEYKGLFEISQSRLFKELKYKREKLMFKEDLVKNFFGDQCFNNKLAEPKKPKNSDKENIQVVDSLFFPFLAQCISIYEYR